MVANCCTQGDRTTAEQGVGGKAQKDAIRNGVMAGAITQNPVGIGYETVKAALEASQGKEVPAHIDTGFYYYDKSNIDDPKIAAVLYD